jgi:glycosyltransferase involved in cell wall biosynthesis
MMRILVLPDSEPEKIRTEGQKWAFFRHWPEGTYRFDWIGAHVVPFWSRWVEGRILKAFIAQSVVAWFREREYDMVIAHGSRSIVALALLHRLFRRKSPKLVVFDIESLGRPRAGLKLWLVKRAVEALDGVVFHSRVQEDYYRDFLPGLAGKSRFVALGFGMTPKRLSWEETGRGDFILALGTTARGRREWTTLLDALQRVPKRPGVRVVGAPDFPDRNVPGVELVPRMPASELRLLMERCSIAILPLSERGHSHGQLALLDLMAAGAPVLVSDTSGTRDYVRDGETAILYRASDAEDLAAKLRWAIEHSEERREISRRGHDAVRDEFTVESFSRRVFEFVSDLSGSPAGGSPSVDSI